MKIEDRIADLERRVAQIERVEAPWMPLGPRSYEDDLNNERESLIKQIIAELDRRRVAP